MPGMLTDLADVMRSTGFHVVELAGWQTRSRANNSGRYLNGRPTHIMVHHTASPATSHNTTARELSEAKYCGINHPDKPVSNLYLGPSGIWYILAAGPSNTNGLGRDWWGGGVPDNSMNSYAIAIEAGNDGVGELWPEVMLDSYVKGCYALCRAYDIPAHRVRAHFEWAPTRKIDPAAGRTSNRFNSGDRNGKFDMNKFRDEVNHYLIFGPNPPEQPEPQPEPQPQPEPAPVDPGLVNPDPRVPLIENVPKWWFNGDPIPWVAFGRGATGEWVTKIQYALRVHQSPDLAVDGDFGEQTESHLHWWQSTKGVQGYAPGVADIVTARSLGFNAHDPAPAPTPEPTPPPASGVPDPNLRPQEIWTDLREGSTGQKVVEIQFALSVHQKPIPCDGEYGPVTRDNVHWWQATRGVQGFEPGVVDIPTARSLGFNAVAAPPPPPPAPEPAPVDVALVGEGSYYVKSGDSPWSVAAIVYGTGSRHQELVNANPGTWAPGQMIRVPGVPAMRGVVRDGDSPYAILKRFASAGVAPTEPDAYAARMLDKFFAWNGGQGRALHPGDVVFCPIG